MGPSLSWPIAWSQVARELGRLTRRRWTGRAAAGVNASGAGGTRDARRDLRLEATLAASATRRRCARLRVEFPARRARRASRPTGSASASPGSSRRPWLPFPTTTTPCDPMGPTSRSASATGWSRPVGSSAGGTRSAGQPDPQQQRAAAAVIALDRNESTPLDVPVLRWLGPWRFSTFMGRFEGDREPGGATLRHACRDPAPPDVADRREPHRAMVRRGRSLRPRPFWDLLVGHDHGGLSGRRRTNRGFDLRWSWPGARVPLTIYARPLARTGRGRCL